MTRMPRRAATKDGVKASGRSKDVLAATEGSTERLQTLNVYLDDGWMMVLRRRFEVVGADPRHAIHALIHIDSGEYFVRAWDVTVESGCADSAGEMEALLNRTFDQTLACVGMFNATNSDVEDVEDPYWTGAPFQRRLNKKCLRIYVVPPETTPEEQQGLGFCPQCKGGPNIKCEVGSDEEEEEETEEQMMSGLESFSSQLKEEEEENEEDEDDDNDNDLEDESFETTDEAGVDTKEGILVKPKKKSKARSEGMTGMPKLSRKNTRMTIIEMHNEGKTKTQIARLLQIGRSTVYNVIRRHGKFGNVEDRPRSGRPRASGASSRRPDLVWPWQCEVCGKAFNTKKRLDDHTNMHTGEKPYRCDECDAAYCFEASLAAHKQAHMRKKTAEGDEEAVKMRHVCDQCGATFASAAYLRHHSKRRHGEAGPGGEVTVFDDSAKCGACEQVFSTRIKMLRHFHREHSNQYQCDLCGKRFGDRGTLNNHVLSHSEPSFICRHCGKALSNHHNLASHERIHTGEKPFSCNLCPYSCMSSATLSLHKKFKHRLPNATRKRTKAPLQMSMVGVMGDVGTGVPVETGGMPPPLNMIAPGEDANQSETENEVDQSN